MNIVVDASLLVAALTEPAPRGVWSEHVMEAHTLLAPHQVRAEVTNALRRLEYNRQITTTVANSAHAELGLFAIEQFPFSPFADRIWELRHSVTSYDAWYVAIAEHLACPLATLDLRLAHALGPRCVFLTPETS